MVSSSSKQIDEAIQACMAMTPSALAEYKPATNAEAMAKKLVLTATTSDDEGLAVRTIQLIADRTDGRATAGSRKQSTGHDLMMELMETIRDAG